MLRYSKISAGILILGYSSIKFHDYSLLKNNLFVEDVSEIKKIKLKEHPINKNEKNREKILIIGGGIVGLTTAFYLNQTEKFDITLIERNDNVSMESSYKNGCNFCPSLFEPWINNNTLHYIFKSLFHKDYPIKISLSFLNDYFIFNYIFNVLINLKKENVFQNRDKIYNITKQSNIELQKLYSQNLFTPKDLESNTKGNLALYSDEKSIKYEHFLLKIDKGLTGKIIKNEEIYEQEPNLIKQNLNAGVIIDGDTSINIYALDKKLQSIMLEKYSDNFRIATSSNFEKFIFNKMNEIIGINTNQGYILADKIIIAAGNNTKEILRNLAIKIPIVPVKGHVLSSPVPINKSSLNFNITDDISKMYLTQINNVYRLSGAADFCGYNYDIDKKRVNNLKQFLIEKIGNVDVDKLEPWCCLRPVSADDVPIVSDFKNYNNLFVNAGHGSKGLTLAFGTGVLMRDIILKKESIFKKKDYSVYRFYFV